MKFKIYSRYDGWAIQCSSSIDPDDYWSWDHQDFESGAGGEKIFGEILECLGHKVEYIEDC